MALGWEPFSLVRGWCLRKQRASMPLCSCAMFLRSACCVQWGHPPIRGFRQWVISADLEPPTESSVPGVLESRTPWNINEWLAPILYWCMQGTSGSPAGGRRQRAHAILEACMHGAGTGGRLCPITCRPPPHCDHKASLAHQVAVPCKTGRVSRPAEKHHAPTVHPPSRRNR